MNRGFKKRLERLEDRVSLAQGSSLIVEFDPKVWDVDGLPPPEPQPHFGPPPEKIVVRFVRPPWSEDSTP